MEIVNRNGNQLMRKTEESGALQKTETQLTATQQSQISQIAGNCVTPLGELVALITESLGRAEAEIKITERITIKET